MYGKFTLMNCAKLKSLNFIKRSYKFQMSVFKWCFIMYNQTQLFAYSQKFLSIRYDIQNNEKISFCLVLSQKVKIALKWQLLRLIQIFLRTSFEVFRNRFYKLNLKNVSALGHILIFLNKLFLSSVFLSYESVRPNHFPISQ